LAGRQKLAPSAYTYGTRRLLASSARSRKVRRSVVLTLTSLPVALQHAACNNNRVHIAWVGLHYGILGLVQEQVEALSVAEGILGPETIANNQVTAEQTTQCAEQVANNVSSDMLTCPRRYGRGGSPFSCT
jgi:hypothetical protein